MWEMRLAVFSSPPLRQLVRPAPYQRPNANRNGNAQTRIPDYRHESELRRIPGLELTLCLSMAVYIDRMPGA